MKTHKPGSTKPEDYWYRAYLKQFEENRLLKAELEKFREQFYAEVEKKFDAYINDVVEHFSKRYKGC